MLPGHFRRRPWNYTRPLNCIAQESSCWTSFREDHRRRLIADHCPFHAARTDLWPRTVVPTNAALTARRQEEHLVFDSVGRQRPP